MHSWYMYTCMMMGAGKKGERGNFFYITYDRHVLKKQKKLEFTGLPMPAYIHTYIHTCRNAQIALRPCSLSLFGIYCRL